MADKKITELDVATSISSGDLIPIVQSGTNKQLDFDDLVTSLESNLSLSIYAKAALIGGLRSYVR